MHVPHIIYQKRNKLLFQVYNYIQFDILIHNQYGYHFQNIGNKFKNLSTSIMMIYVKKFNLILVFLEKTKTPKNNTERTFF